MSKKPVNRSIVLDPNSYASLEHYYSTRTAKVVNAFVKGWSTGKVSTQFRIGKMSAAAYKANFTRGTYEDLTF